VGPYDVYDTFPAMCAIPGVTSPATPTPNWTPTPAGTPASTPIGGTPYPTSPASTPFPTSTVAPIAFPTTQSEITPTPWGSYTMPSISFPSVSFPDIPPAEVIDMGVPTTSPGGTVPTVVSGNSAGLVTRIYQVNDNWAGAVATAEMNADISQDVTGVGSPAALANVVTQNIGAPISYFKAVLVYMPNAAPYLGVLLLMAAWVAFNVMAQPMIGVLKVVLELIRRLWEAIPLN